MATNAELRNVMAPLLQLSPEEVSPNTSLQRFGSSLERTKLELALRRIGLKLPSGLVGPRFADFENQLGLNGGSRPTEEATSSSPLAVEAPIAGESRGDFNIGVDIELIASLPDAADPWESDFYKNTFTSSEIAACLVQQVPRIHFAGNWCAKEALRKSNPAYSTLDWQSMRLDHTPDGAPFLQVMQGGGWKRLPCAVSISHTEEMATAVVAWSQQQPTLPVAIPVAPRARPHTREPVAPAVVPGSKGVPVAIALSIAALVMSLFVLLR